MDTETARAQVAAAVRGYYADLAPVTPEEFHAGMLELTAEIGLEVGLGIRWEHVAAALAALEQLDTLEAGMHPDMIENAAGTVSNRAALADYWGGEFLAAVSLAVSTAEPADGAPLTRAEVTEGRPAPADWRGEHSADL